MNTKIMSQCMKAYGKKEGAATLLFFCLCDGIVYNYRMLKTT